MSLRSVLFPFLAFVSFGLQAAELVVSQIGPMTGPLGGNGTANYLGAKACFDQVNQEGGIHGNKIRLVVEDDQYKAEETLRLVTMVAQRDRPLAFINLLGSANVAGVLKEKTMERLRIPVVGVTPGAENLRNPGSPWMFHIHAGDHAQVKRILVHLATLGVNRLAVVYQDLPFGKGGMQFADETAPQLKLTIAARVVVPAGADDLKAAAAELRESQAQAYLMILAPNSGIALVRDVRSAGDATPIYGLSYVPVQGIVKKSGAAAAAGVALAQVTPNPSAQNSGLTRSFHAAMDKYAPAGTEHSQLHLIGCMAARVVVEGLRRAGPSPTPEKLRDALRQLRTDLGGYNIDFTAGNVGSQFVDIGVIDRSSRLLY